MFNQVKLNSINLNDDGDNYGDNFQGRGSG